MVGSVALTALTLYLALMLGAWGFGYRRFAAHGGRLSRLLKQTPRLDQVVEGLRNDGSPLLDSPAGPEQLRDAAARWGGARRDEVVEKGARWPQTRVFLAGDMIYFIYFDTDGVMKDFTCVSR